MVVAFLAIGLAGARPSFAQAGAIGSVDLHKVATSYTKRSTAQDQLQQVLNQYQQVFSTQSAYPMLTADQR